MNRLCYLLHMARHFLGPDTGYTCSRCGYPWHQYEWFASAHRENNQWVHRNYRGPWSVS